MVQITTHSTSSAHEFSWLFRMIGEAMKLVTIMMIPIEKSQRPLIMLQLIANAIIAVSRAWFTIESMLAQLPKVLSVCKSLVMTRKNTKIATGHTSVFQMFE
jgi:hypothetical protein